MKSYIKKEMNFVVYKDNVKYLARDNIKEIRYK